MSQAPQTTILGKLPSFTALQTQEDLTLLSLMSTLWRHKWIMLFSVVIFIILGGYYAFGVADSKYASITTLTLQPRNEQLIDIEKVISGVSPNEETINTELQVIKSRALLEKLIEKIDLISDPEFNTRLRQDKSFSAGQLRRTISTVLTDLFSDSPIREERDEAARRRMMMIETVDELKRAITTDYLRDTYIYHIRVTTGNPTKSERLANALADVYIQDQIDQKFIATERAITWLADRVAELSIELEEKQDLAESMRAQLDLVNTDALEIANRRARSLRTQLENAQADLARLVAQREALNQANASISPEDLALQLNDPFLDRLLSGLNDNDAQALELFENRVEELRSSLDTDILRTEQKIAALRPSLVQVEAEMATQSDDLLAFQQLERDLQSTRSLYETFLNRLKEASVQRGLQQADSRVLSAATPGLPVAPRRTRILLLSGVLGLMFGAGIVSLRQFKRRGVRTAEDLETLTGLSVLGQIPKMPIRKRMDLLPYLENKPASAAAEAIRNLRTSLMLNNIDTPPQLIMSTSAVPGEGKTTHSITLARNLANLDKRVLLMEGDLRRLNFHMYFGTSRDASGLVATLSGDSPLEEVITRHDGSNLDLLTGGLTTSNPVDIFASEGFATLLRTLRTQYDYIIIDTPPLLAVPDALVIGQYVDAVLISVAWDKTPREQIIQALRKLETVNIQPAGLVLSMIDPKGMRRYGYYSYYDTYNSPYHKN